MLGPVAISTPAHKSPIFIGTRSEETFDDLFKTLAPRHGKVIHFYTPITAEERGETLEISDQEIFVAGRIMRRRETQILDTLEGVDA